ncbi:aminodeoxychorismate synthase component I [Nitratireductor sp. XY-223]|uniref:aminodeoxychorismate synthase component I n=1 Tax=Nitratireductor sp. XY-223 TaxID=2561926 RepID=UPI0010AAC51A|nr:aminodeoxychorismate synthase component I [Nitratireductor sp. XY-223]
MHDHFILFRNDFTGENLFFSDALYMVTAWTMDEVEPALAELQDARQRGLWSAGFISYEAGFALDPALRERLAPRMGQRSCPLLCFGVFPAPHPPQTARELLERGDNATVLSRARPRWNFDRYRARFDRLRAHLHAGDCFQANLTFEITARYESGSVPLFNTLRARQAVAHGALVRLEGPEIVSRSPELFFRVGRDGWIESKPMKGTAPRGRTREEDRRFRRQLESDPKCRSENLMIVDLLRNDLSRVCAAGSVEVPQLYHVESFATVHQMVSRVRGKLHPDTKVADIFRAIFPCGSITGAPKIRAMEIIHALEDTDRGAYCGSIGWIAPGGPMEFNVAIRTISLHPDGEAVFNVGGGIIFDSDARSEYEECLVKARYALSEAALPVGMTT